MTVVAPCLRTLRMSRRGETTKALIIVVLSIGTAALFTTLTVFFFGLSAVPPDVSHRLSSTVSDQAKREYRSMSLMNQGRPWQRGVHVQHRRRRSTGRQQGDAHNGLGRTDSAASDSHRKPMMNGSASTATMSAQQSSTPAPRAQAPDQALERALSRVQKAITAVAARLAQQKTDSVDGQLIAAFPPCAWSRRAALEPAKLKGSSFFLSAARFLNR